MIVILSPLPPISHYEMGNNITKGIGGETGHNL